LELHLFVFIIVSLTSITRFNHTGLWQDWLGDEL
jgi:hypothetical protein